MILRHEEGIAYGLEGLSAIAAIARRGPTGRASWPGGRRDPTSAPPCSTHPAFVFHTRYLDVLAAQGAGDRIRCGGDARRGVRCAARPRSTHSAGAMVHGGRRTDTRGAASPGAFDAIRAMMWS